MNEIIEDNPKSLGSLLGVNVIPPNIQDASRATSGGFSQHCYRKSDTRSLAVFEASLIICPSANFFIIFFFWRGTVS
jgi:hypothetical protein